MFDFIEERIVPEFPTQVCDQEENPTSLKLKKFQGKVTCYHRIGSLVHIVEAKRESQDLQENKEVFIEKRRYNDSLQRYQLSQVSHNRHVGSKVHDSDAKHESWHLPGTDDKYPCMAAWDSQSSDHSDWATWHVLGVLLLPDFFSDSRVIYPINPTLRFEMIWSKSA